MAEVSPAPVTPSPPAPAATTDSGLLGSLSTIQMIGIAIAVIVVLLIVYWLYKVMVSKKCSADAAKKETTASSGFNLRDAIARLLTKQESIQKTLSEVAAF